MILPVIAPAFAVGFPLPGALGTPLKAIPTSQAAHLLVNGLSGESIFPGVWLSFAVLALWAAAAYALLLRQLARREV